MLIPLVTFEEIDLFSANECLTRWGHKMGPLERGNQAGVHYALCHDGRPVAVAMTSTLIRERVGGGLGHMTRENACELSNYQQHMHVVAQDLDEKAVHMAYVQLSLMHIPAVVIHGNTLSLEERARWYTPAHILGGWGWRLARADRADQVELVKEGMASGQPNGFKASQLNLFEEELAA